MRWRGPTARSGNGTSTMWKIDPNTIYSLDDVRRECEALGVDWDRVQRHVRHLRKIGQSLIFGQSLIDAFRTAAIARESGESTTRQLTATPTRPNLPIRPRRGSTNPTLARAAQL